MCSKFCFSMQDSFFLFHENDGKVLRALAMEVKGTRLGQIKPCIIISHVLFCTLIINEYSDL